MNANFNEHFGTHIGGIGTEVHRQWVMYIAPKEEEGNLSKELTPLKYRWGMSLCPYLASNIW